MKILISTPYYPPHIGGIEIHSKSLANGLLDRGYEVEVLTSYGTDERVKVTTARCIPAPYTPIPLYCPPVKGDLYHSHIPSPFFAKYLHKRNSKPHVITYHNDVDIPERVDGRNLPTKACRWVENRNSNFISPVLDDADRIIATTESYATTSPLLKERMDNVEIIPNAIHVREYIQGIEAGDREPIILYVGRLVEYKGLQLLIRAVRETGGKLVVVGDGEDRKMFEQLSRKLEVDADFRGRVPFKEVKGWLSTARVLVLPAISRLEAFGIVLLEAMASKTPVIGSNIPGVAEVAKQGGFTFDDVEELAYHISNLINDDNLATKTGKRGWDNVQKYDWGMVLGEIERVYREVMAGK